MAFWKQIYVHIICEKAWGGVIIFLAGRVTPQSPRSNSLLVSQVDLFSAIYVHTVVLIVTYLLLSLACV